MSILQSSVPILFEDESLLVINKPPGVVVNRAETQKDETLEQWLLEEKKITIERSGIVHRLDKDTSGILVVAKTLDAMTALQAQFANRTTEKEYIALGHGLLSPTSGVISAALARNPGNRTKFAVTEDGRESETRWQVENYYVLPQEKIAALIPNLNKNQHRYYLQQAQHYTLVRLFPKTGRTHQIRVHLLSLRHPIVSDTVYTSRKLLRLDLLWCARQFLHAQKLSFDHPISRKRMSFEAGIPEDLQKSLANLIAQDA